MYQKTQSAGRLKKDDRPPDQRGGPMNALLFLPKPQTPNRPSPEARTLPGEAVAVVRLVQLVEEVGARGHDPVRVERWVRPVWCMFIQQKHHMDQS